MAVGQFRSESALEFFKEEVESAMARQHLRTSEWTSYYVVKLLAGYVAAGHDDQTFDGQPLGLRLAHALQSEGAAQREGLRSVGDASLFVAGFFSDSLNRRLVDCEYYIALGANAYGRLAVIAQATSHAKTVMDVPARAFTPPPKVESAVVRLTPRADRPSAERLDALQKITAAAFGQRRKMLRGSLSGIFADPVPVLQGLGLSPTARAEELSVADFVRLARAFNGPRAAP